MIVVAAVALIFEIVAMIFGLKTAQLNKLNGGNDVHLLVGRIVWVTAAVLIVFTLALVLDVYLL